MSQTARTRFTENLAAAFYAHNWTARDLRKAAAVVTGKRYAWVNTLIKRLFTAFTEKPAFPMLLAFLNQDRGLSRIFQEIDWHEEYFPMPCLFFPPITPTQNPPWATGLPDLPTPAALAAWLNIALGQLDWLADLSGRNRLHPIGPLRTYRYRWVPKRSGQARLLEIPTPLLKQAQRKLLDDLLNLVPTHPAAHGFRPGRSAATNASSHCGRAVVIRFDLTDFFPSVIVGRVFALFRTLGYPTSVARLLAGLCTTRLPRAVWEARPNPTVDGSDHSTWQRFGARHLPQGTPTSPAIANLVAFRLDHRLTGLAANLDATYTRYADDLTFSGGLDLGRCTKRLTALVALIAGEEGFTLNHRKTRVLRQGGRQMVTGVVVNARPNLPRVEFDRLKAILTNCVRHGPATQNRENRPDFRAYLTGKVAHFGAINAARGQKLWELLDRIVWP
jgi:RNA-directed DNA polymerase